MDSKYHKMRIDREGEVVHIAYQDSPVAQHVTPRGIMLLLHDFPQTSHQYRHVIPLFDHAGYRCIVPDYHGAGKSSKTHSGFSKTAMAADMIALLKQLRIDEAVHVVGHDIGGMIAYAVATRHAEHVKSACWGECPLPGTSVYEQDRTEHAIQQFHFIFHSVPDLPEALVEGKECLYVTHFLFKICHNTSAFPESTIDEYVTAYSQPGAMACAFGVYRVFEQDAKENKAWIDEHGLCHVPTLILSGEVSRHKAQAELMASEVVNEDALTVAEVVGAAHYLAEESPSSFANQILQFVDHYRQLLSPVPID